MSTELQYNNLYIVDANGHKLAAIAPGGYESVRMGSDGLEVGVSGYDYLLFSSDGSKPIYYVTPDAKFMVAPSAANFATVVNNDGTETITATPASGFYPTWQSVKTVLNSTDGDIISRVVNTPNGSVVSAYTGNIVTTGTWSGLNGSGALLSTSYAFDVTMGDQQAGASLTYNAIAEQLGLAGVSGDVLAALNYATSGDVAPEQALIVIPIVDTGLQALTSSGPSSSGIPSNDDVAFIVDKDTMTYEAIGTQPPVGTGRAQATYYIVNDAGTLISAYNVSLVDSVAQQTGGNGPSPNAQHAKAAAVTYSDDDNGTYAEVVVTAGDSTATFTADSDVPVITGTAFSESGALLAQPVVISLNSTSDLPDQNWSIVGASTTSVTFTGLAGSGYTGTVMVSSTSQVDVGGGVYSIQILNGGTETLDSSDDGDLLAETASGGNTIAFQQDGTVYWHVAGPGDTATLSSGDTEIYMAGSAADYTESFDASTDTLTLTATAAGSTGTTTIDLASSLGGGTGEVVFTDGTTLGLGDVGDEVEYATTSAYGNLSKRFTLDGGDQTLHGTGASTIANFTSGDATPDDSWDIYQDAAGDVVMDGTDAGYDGTATMSGVAAAVLGYAGAGTGTAYSLAVTPGGGGSVTVGNPAAISTSPIVTPVATILAERYGATDTVTISSAHTVYWQVNGTNDTVHLNAGLTELYLPGDQTDYALTYNASTGTATLVDSVTGRTGTLTIDGSARAELNFADGQVTDLNNTTADADLSRTLIGLGAYADPASWFFSAGAGGAIVADGTNDGYGATTLLNATGATMSGTSYHFQLLPPARAGRRTWRATARWWSMAARTRR